MIDIAILRTYHKTKSTRPLTHVKFLKRLHLQLIQLQETDMYDGNAFAEERAAVSATSGAETSRMSAHVAQLVDEWRNQ
ncbi:LOW QUALITY PROTEIN: hypothetical protein PHMEG_00016205 [Phytophthora megakarya]|uniref:Uncharacterized protein n=1 Tax=Phytophthora megakarya TaxID=4795 RepID=A0A225VZW0_9STRA|nr:LOW QUALITY PROTEIN: hypothetical protein PHMEG_00016205 [Phytophthora megakarya]